MCTLVSLTYMVVDISSILVNPYIYIYIFLWLLNGHFTTAGINDILVTLNGTGRFIPQSAETWQSANHVYPDNKDHGANMGPTWVLSAPGGPHVGSINLVIRVWCLGCVVFCVCCYWCTKSLYGIVTWALTVKLIRKISQNISDKKSTLVDVMAWFHGKKNLMKWAKVNLDIWRHMIYYATVGFNDSTYPTFLLSSWLLLSSRLIYTINVSNNTNMK